MTRIIENLKFNQFEISYFRLNDDKNCYLVNAAYDGKYCIIGRDKYQERYHIIMYRHHFFYDNSIDFWGAIFNLFNVKEPSEEFTEPEDLYTIDQQIF